MAIPTPPTFNDIFNAFQQSHIAQYGIPMDRPWTADADATNVKLALDAQYQKAIDAYNRQYGTNITPDASVIGVNAQTTPYTPKPANNGFFGGLIQGVSDAATGISRAIADNPIGQAAITAIAAANGVDPVTTATILGVNQAADKNNLAAGLTTGALSFAGGTALNNSGLLGGASSGTAGAASVAPSAATGAITSGPFAGATAAELTAANAGSGAVTGGLGSMASTAPTVSQWDAMIAAGAPISAGAASVVPGLIAAAPPAATAPATNSVLADSAANSAGYGASSAGAGLNAGASVGGAMTLDEITKFITDNKSVLGAAAGALASGPSSTTTTADKSPWAPAQEWMKANIARGQELQKQYQANPFSAFQQQAYNNQAGLGNSFRGAVNSLIPQMNSFQPYRRTPQSQVVSPFQFANPNLGFTSKPFGA